jgi:hypothetical protein
LFEQNDGQFASDVRYVCRMRGFSASCADQSFVIRLGRAERHLALQPVGIETAAKWIGEQELDGKSHYFVGRSSDEWVRNVPVFSRAVWCGVYPGVNFVFYESAGAIEYDTQVAPGADANRIELRFAGADG